jgi:hypothetical protein
VLTGISLQAQHTISGKPLRTVINNAFLCDVTQDGIFFVNIQGDVNLKFYTSPSEASGGPNSFTYEWTFTYADNSTSQSFDREPYIPVPCDNPIVFAYVKVSSATCFKEITKNYHAIGVCGGGGLTYAQTGSKSFGKKK